MNGKEIRFLEAFEEQARRAEEAGRILRQVTEGEAAAGEGWTQIRELASRTQAACPVLYEKMVRAFRERPEIETARRLLLAAETLMREAEELAARLALYGPAETDGLRVMAELVQHALHELARMAAYGRTLPDDYLKAEARAQRIRNYEARGAECFLASLRPMTAADDRLQEALRQTPLYEGMRRMLRTAADCAGLYGETVQGLL